MLNQHYSLSKLITINYIFIGKNRKRKEKGMKKLRKEVESKSIKTHNEEFFFKRFKPPKTTRDKEYQKQTTSNIENEK